MVATIGKFAAALIAGSSLVSGLGSIAAGKEAEGLAEEEAAQIEKAAEFNRGLARERSRRLMATNVAESGNTLGRSNYQVILDNLIQSEYEADIQKFNALSRADMTRREGQMAKREAFRQGFGQIAAGATTYGIGAWEGKWFTKQPTPWSNLQSSPIR